MQNAPGRIDRGLSVEMHVEQSHRLEVNRQKSGKDVN